MFTIQEILDMAIRIEKNGEAVYRRAIEIIPNRALSSSLEWMADEEVNHARWFSNMKQQVGTLSKDPFMEKMGSELLNDMMGDQSFSLKEVDFSQVAQIHDLIPIFIEFEKDSILFFEMLQMFTLQEDILGRLNRIIAEEKQHIRQLQDLLATSQ